MQFLAGTAVISGVLVLLGWFTLPVRIAILIIIAVLAWRDLKRQAPCLKQSFRAACSLRLAACGSAALATALLLWSSGTTDPIRSPWSVVPTPFFFLYALMAAIAVISPKTIASYFLLLTSALVAILVYPLGFGFDHFIHAAAERIIAATGALSPTPLFYSAHYGLTILLADLLPWVDVALADRLLAPLLSLLLIPLAHRAFRTILPERSALLGIGSLIIVPFLPLAVSTPQATANVFALATVFLLFGSSSSRQRGGVAPRPHLSAALLTALAAFFAQPMTGIITLTIVVTTFALRHRQQAIAGIIAAAGAIGIPLAFAIASRVVPQLDVVVSFAPLAATQRLWYALRDAATFAATDFSTADALTIARIVLPLLWIGLAVAGAMRHFARQSNGDHSLIRANRRIVYSAQILAPIIAVLTAAAIAATITIPTQLGEEQSQFPLRLVQLAALLATPLAGIGLGALLDRVRGRCSQLAATVAFAAVATFILLLAYPRDDAQTRSGLWSVSASDITAVHAIAEDADGAPYVVLANQMLGAAAIQELGFRPSYIVCTEPSSKPEFCNLKSEILSFPLPAGGPVARKYWEFVNAPEPLRAPIEEAMTFVGASRAYVVLHDYWRNYLTTAAATAAMADGELAPIRHLRIFRFMRAPLPE